MAARRIQLLLPLVHEGPGLPNDLRARLSESVQSAVLVSVTTVFSSDATLGDRQVELRWLDKDGNVKGVAGAAALQAPSSAVEYVWGLTGAAYASGLGNVQHVPFRMEAQGGDVLQLKELNEITANDSFASPVAFFNAVFEESVGRGLRERRKG